MKKWTMGLLAMFSLLLLAVDYDEERISKDLGKLFKLDTFEYEGKKILSVGVNQTSDAEYGDLLKHFYPYFVMISQLAETQKLCASLQALPPAEAEAALTEQLRSHPFLKKELLPLMARYLKVKGYSVNVALDPKSEYKAEILRPITARFFYPHLVNGKFRLHVCSGINGLKTLDPEPPASLVAFSYQVISNGLMAGRSDINEIVDRINFAWNEKEGQDIQAFQNDTWRWLENDQRLKGLLQEEYDLVRDTLPFILMTGEDSKKQKK